MNPPLNLALSAVDVARWQFGVTTLYHYLFVPLTIGLSCLTAGLQTAWHRTGDRRYYRATRFWGKLFLINFAMGVVTGIVQEFQFGMNWSAYSRFVGDVFGAPLAIEALLAFFLESTFLGLWIFGWDRLPRRLHLAAIWCAAIGTLLSGYFILAANCWMQHPVGYRLVTHHGLRSAQLTDIAAVLTQNTVLVAFAHTITAAFLTSGALFVGVSAYHVARRQHLPVMRMSLRYGLVVTAVAGALVALSGDTIGKVMYDQQPMKMASAEALWDSAKPAPFSVFAYGDVAKGHNTVALEVPGALSFLAKTSFDARLPGINDINAQYRKTYGPGDYRPVIPITYWSFRLMIGVGMTSCAVAMAGLWLTRRWRHDPDDTTLWLTRRRTLPGQRWWFRIAVLTLACPLLGNSFGWIFTEMGRQPWVVFGLLKTKDAVSPSVSAASMLTSLIVLTVLYAALAVVEVRLMVTYAKAGPAEEEPPHEVKRLRGGGDGDDAGEGADAERPLAFAY